MMMGQHDHTDLMSTREIHALLAEMREHFDGRFDVLDIRGQQTAHTLNEVVRQQRETNGQVAKLSMWRAEVKGQLDGMRVAAGGARSIWLGLTAGITTAVAIIGLVAALLRTVLG